MKRKLVFTLATSVGLLLAIGAAYAGSNNWAIISQSQTNNSADVDQSGGSYNTTEFTQNGDQNSVTIKQTNGGSIYNKNYVGNHQNVTDTYGVVYQNGDHNSIDVKQNGADSVANGNAGAGSLLQTGNYNSASITQTGSADAVIGAVQSGMGTAPVPANQLTVTQSNAPNNHYADLPLNTSDYNYGDEYIGHILQTNTGGVTNTLVLTQTLGVYSAGNTINTVTQNGTGNTASVSQNGRRNFLSSLTQTGAGNSSTITLQGDSNGSNGASSQAVSFSSAAASGVGVGQAVVSQTGGDTANYSAFGNSNLYGFAQSGGTGNSITGTATGNANEVAIKQVGSGNLTDFTQVGNGNALGVSLNGDDNGFGSFTAGPAQTLAAAAGAALLAEGNIYQNSSSAAGGNTATYTVYGSNNRFAFAQVGGGNTISGTVGDPVNYSPGNQIAVLQQGNNNTTTFVQKGSGGTNNASITQ